jgi:hypothetical protein
MTIQKFKETLKNKFPPQGVSETVEALWHDARGDWESAHNIAQSQEGVHDYDLLHAYLHRKEGDDWNARYWYNRANSAMPTVSLEMEWEVLLTAFL